MTCQHAELLRACYLSSQMSEAQWQEHLRNGDVAEDTFPAASQAKTLGDMLSDLEAIYDVRLPPRNGPRLAGPAPRARASKPARRYLAARRHDAF